jgi:hypothetical protein
VALAFPGAFPAFKANVRQTSTAAATLAALAGLVQPQPPEATAVVKSIVAIPYLCFIIESQHLMKSSVPGTIGMTFPGTGSGWQPGGAMTFEDTRFNNGLNPSSSPNRMVFRRCALPTSGTPGSAEIDKWVEYIEFDNCPSGTVNCQNSCINSIVIKNGSALSFAGTGENVIVDGPTTVNCTFQLGPTVSGRGTSFAFTNGASAAGWSAAPCTDSRNGVIHPYG